MKRIALFLLLHLICLNLGACFLLPDPTVPASGFPEANFNNNYWFSGDFWAFEDQVFYLQDGFYNMGAYWDANGKNKKLFEESDFLNDSVTDSFIGDIFVCGSDLYFDLITNDVHWLYRYDLNEHTYAPVCQTPPLYRWTVLNHYFIYREHPTNNDEGYSPLYIYTLTDGTTTQVCSDVIEFGIVGEQLRYVTCSNVYILHQYSFSENSSTVLGQFPCEFDAPYDLFNFTNDAVIMHNWSRKNDRYLAVYTLSTDSSTVYTLPRSIQHMVAYDQYAYAVLYDTLTYSSTVLPSVKNGIYRIDLANGNYEVIENSISEGTEIHVISDDRLYIIERKKNFISLNRRHVYAFDYITGTKEKITDY